MTGGDGGEDGGRATKDGGRAAEDRGRVTEDGGRSVEDGADVSVHAKSWREYGSTSATWAVPSSTYSYNYSCEFAFSTLSSLLTMFIALLV
jgi:hypothetical protein